MLAAWPLWAQTTAQTVLVLPFENQSKAPGLEWISEAFPEVLGDGFSSSGLYVISRDDRTTAFDRMGMPVGAHLSRATLYRISEQIDADYVVYGTYNYDGQAFTAAAQLLDMKKLYLGPERWRGTCCAHSIRNQRRKNKRSWERRRRCASTLSRTMCEA